MYRDKDVRHPDHGIYLWINYPGSDFTTVIHRIWGHWAGADDLPAKRAVNPHVSYGVEEVRYTERLQSYVGERWTYYGYMYGDPQDASVEVTSYLPVWGKLQQLVQGHSLNAGVTLAEGHKSIATVLGGLKRLTKSMTNLRKGNIIGAITALGVQTSDAGKSYDVKAGTKGFARGYRRYRVKKDPKVDLAGCWLELQYGWKPILSDIYESMNVFFAHRKTAIRAKTFRVSRVQNIGFKRPNVIGSSISQPPSIVPTSSGWQPINDCVMGIHAVITESTPLLTELGLQDPLSIAWELIPFSFVADWFLPIGSFLETLSFVQRTNGTFSTKRLRRKTWAYNFPGLVYYSGSNPSTWFKFDRVGIHYFDVRSYRDWNFVRSASQPITSASVLTSNSLPAFKPLVKVATASHVASAIALFAVASRGGPMPRLSR